MGVGERTRASLLLIVAAATAVVILAIAGVTTIYYRGESKEPTYEGRPLSYWLNAHHEGMKLNQAVLAIGPAATPFILADLRARDSELKRQFGRLMKKQTLIDYRYVPAHVRHLRAIHACSILRTNAAFAVPELEALLYEPNPSTQLPLALGRTGLPGTLALARAFTHTNKQVRSEVIGALQISYLGPDALDPAPAITLFTNQLRDPLPDKRVRAADVLGWIHQLQHTRLTALAQSLDDPDARVRRSAVTSLGRLVRNTNAEPVIRRAFLDVDAAVRIEATNALKRLYPPPPINYE